MARIKDLSQVTPNKDDFVVIDGNNGVHKVPLGDLAGVVGATGIAGFHNSIYRGKDITAYHTDGTLGERISSGTFEDLFIGDYFTITITTEYGTETVDCVLAGFDIYMGSVREYFPSLDDCDALERHHVVCVTRDKFRTNHRIQPSGVSYDGYYQCELHTTTLPKYANAMKAVLGDHLIEVCDWYSYDINSEYKNVNYEGLTGATDSGDYGTDFHAHLIPLTERELYGAPAFSCSPYEIGFETAQLPLFRLNPAMKAIGNWYWLKDYAGSGVFCICYDDGYPTYSNAGNSCGVRPRFIIG